MLPRIVISLLLVILLCGCHKQNDGTDGAGTKSPALRNNVAEPEKLDTLFPVTQKGLVGYIDSVGKIVIEPQFGLAGSFHEGLAVVQVGDSPDKKYGYIDQTGNFVIPPQFLHAYDFSEGLAWVDLGPRSGFVNKTGKMVIRDLHINEARPFSEGFSSTRYGDAYGDYFNYIDKTGKHLEDVSLCWGSDFSEGLACVQIPGDEETRYAYYNCSGKYGYIDRTGEFVIEPQFTFAGNFKDGLAPVMTGDYETGKWGYIDQSEMMVIQPQFSDALSFSEGLAAIRIGDELDTKTGKIIYGKYGFIDKTGKIVIEPQFDYVGDFKEGLAVIRIGDDRTGKYGLIDKTGKFVMEPVLDAASDFSNGLASVGVGSDWEKRKYGYIDKTGQFVWKPSN